MSGDSRLQAPADTLQPPRGSEWSIRYRVLGPSQVWPDKFAVCEVLTGPQAGERKLLDLSDFSARLLRAKRTT